MKISNPNLLLILLGFAMIFLEILLGAVTGFDLLLTGVAVILGGFIGTLFNSFIVSLVLILILIVLYIFLLRSIVKKAIHIDTKKTNTENLFGKVAEVIKPITKENPGQVKFEGEIWRAESTTPCKKGDKVVIRSLSGVTLNVEKI